MFQYGSRLGGPRSTYVYPPELVAVVRERLGEPQPQGAYDEDERPNAASVSYKYA